MKFIYLRLLLSVVSIATLHLWRVSPAFAALEPEAKLVVIQTATSDTTTNINVLVPRLRNYEYAVVGGDMNHELVVTPYETVNPRDMLWKIQKLQITGLKPGIDYKLRISHKNSSSNPGVPELENAPLIEERIFSTLNINKDQTRFIFASCLSDSIDFQSERQIMMERASSFKPDFILFSGDIVYVDAKDFVEREKATELDIWLRYIDSIRQTPLFNQKRLTPFLATWDDHDYGTNDGNRNFQGKLFSQAAFKAFFGGQEIPRVYSMAKEGVYSYYHAFGQSFYLMDDRFFRAPTQNGPSPEPFGHWGEIQHKWLLQNLGARQAPTWLINGDQFFGVFEKQETFIRDHPVHFQKLLADLRAIPQLVVFGSGDIHFSEVLRLEPSILGYQSYELTSSPWHSFMFGPPDEPGWPNPRRVAAINKFNFFVIESRVEERGLSLGVKAIGVPPNPYFDLSLSCRKDLVSL